MTAETDFRKQVKEALEHLYDTAYLASHPLVSRVGTLANASQLTRAQQLRSLLKESIETLRPQPDLPATAPEWRSYLALRYRYVQGMSLAQVEGELGISLRQLQRELHKGLDAVALLVWDVLGTAGGEAAGRALPETGEVQGLRNEMAQWQLSREVCEVQSLLDGVQWMLKPLLPDDFNIRFDLPASLSPVLVDSTLTRQALFQSLRLLVQHAAGGEIWVQAATVENHVELKLNGALEAIDLHSPAWQKARLLIERQGGAFSIEQGADSCVAIRLPQASPPLVLVVDDNPAIHDLFERYLAPHFYQLLHAHNGAEALDLAQARSPDAIILDVMMPTVDGWQVLRGLSENPNTSAIPVIICSVLKEPQLALSLGARAYLKKPADRLELLAILAKLQREPAQAGAAPLSTPSNT